jgi:hypothetical protein
MNALKFRLLARSNVACAAQILPHLCAFGVVRPGMKPASTNPAVFLPGRMIHATARDPLTWPWEILVMIA